MKIFLIGLCLGLFIGYLICDLLTTESKITYHIKRLRARKGSTIQVDTEAVQSPPTGLKAKREARKARKSKKRLDRLKEKL